MDTPSLCPAIDMRSLCGKRAARTGEKLKIAAATVPKFSAGAGFKAAVNKKK